MATSGLATRSSNSPSGDFLKTPALAATHVSHIHASLGDNSGWAVAAPERTASDDPLPTPQQATYSATAADFFDLVFVTVALVAYSGDGSSPSAAPRTTTHRATATRASLQLRNGQLPSELSRSVASNSIRFSQSTADTTTISEPLRLSSLNASTPHDRPTLDSRLSALDAHRPTGPPALPHISIRGWTSRYA